MHLLVAGVEDELLVVLVDRVVCEVDVVVFQVLLPSPLVGFGCEPSEPLLVNVDPERVAAVDEDVYPQVELKALDQVRAVEVRLDYPSLALNLLRAGNQADASALRRSLGLEYVYPPVLFCLLGIEAHELPKLGGNRPGRGKKPVLLRKLPTHLHEAFSQEVLLREDLDGRKVADFLVVVEPKKVVGLDVAIGPHDVPGLRLFGVLDSPAEFLHDRFDDVVVRPWVNSFLLERLTTISSGSTFSSPFLVNLAGSSLFFYLLDW
jgi:hypothetical protein